MSNTIETKYKIGDLVYVATSSDIDRDVIKAIKIVGVKERISYGIQVKGYSGIGLLGQLYSNNDGYRWYAASDLFTDVESAENRQKTLQAKEAEKDSAANQKEIIDLERKLKIDQENLRRKKQGLPLLDEEEYDD